MLQRHFALFFSTLALRVGMTCGFEEAAEQCSTGWRNFFTVIQEEDVLEKLVENGVHHGHVLFFFFCCHVGLILVGTLEDMKKEETHINGITNVASVVARRWVVRELLKLVMRCCEMLWGVVRCCWWFDDKLWWRWDGVRWVFSVLIFFFLIYLFWQTSCGDGQDLQVPCTLLEG